MTSELSRTKHIGLVPYLARDTEGHVVLTLIGDLDSSTVAEVDAIVSGDATLIDRVDARLVDFCSAAGISSLLQLNRRQNMDLFSSPAVDRVIEICGLESHFRRCSDGTEFVLNETSFSHVDPQLESSDSAR